MNERYSWFGFWYLINDQYVGINPAPYGILFPILTDTPNQPHIQQIFIGLKSTQYPVRTNKPLEFGRVRAVNVIRYNCVAPRIEFYIIPMHRSRYEWPSKNFGFSCGRTCPQSRKTWPIKWWSYHHKPRIPLVRGWFCHVSKISLFYSTPISFYPNFFLLLFLGGRGVPRGPIIDRYRWCETNTGHLSVRNKHWT